MIDVVRERKKPNLFYLFWYISNLSNFAVVKSLHKFRGCLVDNNTFFFESKF